MNERSLFAQIACSAMPIDSRIWCTQGFFHRHPLAVLVRLNVDRLQLAPDHAQVRRRLFGRDVRLQPPFDEHPSRATAFEPRVAGRGLFQADDGDDFPRTSDFQPVATVAQRRTAYSLLLSKGLIRIGLKLPANRDFDVRVVLNPYESTGANPPSGGGNDPTQDLPAPGDLPPLPSTPGVPQVPGLPELPGVPQVPNAPNLPQVPDAVPTPPALGDQESDGLLDYLFGP